MSNFKKQGTLFCFDVNHNHTTTTVTVDVCDYAFKELKLKVTSKQILETSTHRVEQSVYIHS